MDYPYWLECDLRSDHAGEMGAVWIYRGILAVSRRKEVRAFARRHLETERQHLALMERLLPRQVRSQLLPLWKVAGFVLGALPALVGAGAVFATIEAVETFVDRHYALQIAVLSKDPKWHELCKALEKCRQEEIQHRDEAKGARVGQPGSFTRLWSWTVGTGSAVAVYLARYV